MQHFVINKVLMTQSASCFAPGYRFACVQSTRHGSTDHKTGIMAGAFTSQTKSVRADSKTVRDSAPSSSVTNMPATLYSSSDRLLAASTAGMAQGGSECVICVA